MVSTKVSKTLDLGSIPSAPANINDTLSKVCHLYFILYLYIPLAEVPGIIVKVDFDAFSFACATLV